MPTTEAPDLSIKVNGQAMPMGAFSSVRSVEVHEDLHALSMFELDLDNWDLDTLSYTWSDDKLFALGADVEISLGYVDALTTVMSGEIVSIEPAFTSDRPPSVTVRGYDYRHRLGRARRTRSFAKMKDSAIVAQIAREAGMRAQVTDTKVTFDHVAQSNQSDLEFLRARARLLGFEVFARDKVLYFREPQHAKPPVAQLAMGEDFTEFSPRLSVLGMTGAATVRGWDPAKKAGIVGKSVPEATTMGGTATGAKRADKAFGRAERVMVDVPVQSKERADQVARGGVAAAGLSFIEGAAEGPGRADLKAGTVVALSGIGKTFSGNYYVTSVVHSFTPGAGYRTAIEVRRNAA